MVTRVRHFRIVEVEWLDSVAVEGWVSQRTALEKLAPRYMRHRSVGYLIEDGLAGVVIAASMADHIEPEETDQDRRLGDVTRIPRAAVLTIWSVLGSDPPEEAAEPQTANPMPE